MKSSSMSSALFSLVLLSFLLSVAPVIAAEPQLLQRSDTEMPDGFDNSRFGGAMDAQDVSLVIGAQDVEAAYVFAFDDDEWREVVKLTSIDSETGAGFGSAVAIDGDVIAVSAPEATVDGLADAGAVFVFERNVGGGDWAQVTRLVAADPVTTARFGYNIDLDAGRIIASSREFDGAAYLFERDAAGAWNLAMEFTGQDGGAADVSSVAVSADVIALAEDANGVFIYEHNGFDWLLRKFIAATAEYPSRMYVALEGHVLAVAEPDADTDDERPRNDGVVHVHERDGNWVHVATLQAVDPVAYSSFGIGLDVQDGVLVVTENHETTGTYVFAKDEIGDWRLITSFRQGSVHGYRQAATVSARTLAIGYPGPEIANVYAYDMADLMPAVSDDDDDSGSPDDDTSGVADEGDGEGGDNSGGVADGDDSGSSDDIAMEAGENDTANNEPPEQDTGSGGGLMGWLTALLLFVAGMRRWSNS